MSDCEVIMAESNYLRGRRVEYRAVAELEARGYLAQRAASSKGNYDVYAISPDHVLLVSCKLVKDEKAARRILGSERKKLMGLSDRLPKESVRQALWIWATSLPGKPRGGWFHQGEIPCPHRPESPTP
jgi:hypothetical protein